jgi:hypothetical protein
MHHGDTAWRIVAQRDVAEFHRGRCDRVCVLCYRLEDRRHGATWLALRVRAAPTDWAHGLTRAFLHREIFTVDSDQARQRAERSFKKEQRAQDGQAAVTEYEAEARATREKTARLKALRLAREAEIVIAL